VGNTPEHSLVEDLQATIDARGIQISDVLGQARQLTTVSGLAFGFLLTIAAGTHVFEREIGRVLLAVALVSTASAILIFILPLLYIHLSFPIDKKQILQFYVWSHKFILCGIVPLFVGIYCAVLYALDRIIGYPAAPIVATGMFALPLIVYGLRRIGDPIELA
jgi:hypothetical protein